MKEDRKTDIVKDLDVIYNIYEEMNRKRLLFIGKENYLNEDFLKQLEESFELFFCEDEDKIISVLRNEREKTAAVVTDLDHCENSDYAFLKKLDLDPFYADVPVIAFSKRELKKEDSEAIERGVSDIIVLPCEIKLVLRRISNAVRSKDSLTFSEIEKMLKQLPSNIYLKDKEGRYVFATHYWHHLEHAQDPGWTIRGKTDVEIRKDKENALKAMESDKVLLRTGKGTTYVIEEKADGMREYLELIKEPVFDDEGNVSGIISLINDVTEKELLKLELEKKSTTDQLTGLYNRAATQDLIMKAIEEDRKHGRRSAMMMIDVDHFKFINDTYGHDVGDKVLAGIGELLHECFKGMDVCGRIGGDEFTVFLRGIENEETVEKLIGYLEDGMKEKIFDDRMKQNVTLSIGAAICPDHGDEFEKLYSAADRALYQVKKKGRASHLIYNDSME